MQPSDFNFVGGHPFFFPMVLGRRVTPPPVINLALTNGQRQVLYSSPPGTRGVIRNFSWVNAATNAAGTVATVPDLTFEVHYGGSATPAISMPLLTLAGMEFPGNSLADAIASTDAFELSASIYSALFPGAILGNAGNLRLPIPYTNGIQISVVAPATTDKQAIFSNVVLDDSLPDVWNANLRLTASRSVATIGASGSLATMRFTDSTHALATAGTFPAGIEGQALLVDTLCSSDVLILERTDSTHLLVSGRDTVNATLGVDQAGGFRLLPHTWLSRTSESGWLAMLTIGADGLGNDPSPLFESNPRIFLDGSFDSVLSWTSIEDWANGAYYFEQPHRGAQGGVTTLDLATAFQWSVFKTFTDFPVRYASGIRGTIHNYNNTSSQFRTTALFYVG